MPVSALGHEQTSRNVRVMSVLPLKADIRQREWHVRFVPQTDIEFHMRNGAAVPTVVTPRGAGANPSEPVCTIRRA